MKRGSFVGLGLLLLGGCASVRGETQDLLEEVDCDETIADLSLDADALGRTGQSVVDGFKLRTATGTWSDAAPDDIAVSLSLPGSTVHVITIGPNADLTCASSASLSAKLHVEAYLREFGGDWPTEIVWRDDASGSVSMTVDIPSSDIGDWAPMPEAGETRAGATLEAGYVGDDLWGSVTVLYTTDDGQTASARVLTVLTWGERPDGEAVGL